MLSNLFTGISRQLPDELLTTLVAAEGVKIERIISTGQSSPPDFWYDQSDHEWVLLIKGAARLEFESGVVSLNPGDFVNIPAGKKHRVDWTSPDEPTIWLAVFYK